MFGITPGSTRSAERAPKATRLRSTRRSSPSPWWPMRYGLFLPRRDRARRLSRQRHDPDRRGSSTGRNCRGLELDPAYVDTAIRRWQALTGEQGMPRRRTAAGVIRVSRWRLIEPGRRFGGIVTRPKLPRQSNWAQPCSVTSSAYPTLRRPPASAGSILGHARVENARNEHQRTFTQ
jgi:hypothetical protein